ncbi:hypothetical protein [Aurantiacibacter odishensis]|uniref:hypothetical protein n=1 Tax=Aurantiacibacter odishensis TaxID=1155476 RepID=UPI000E75D9F7|nr:hypothetical protein [Aurantiacibacter odishensis]
MPAPGAGDDGPAFGSLANLGGPRKFKKKPVLVLDPEELEKAHMMFQEASAEMLGEQVERPERPKAVLGLAPIDDEEAAPEDMGESDDAEAGDDNDAIPSAEEVLRITAAREREDQELDPEMQASEDDFIARQLENLDVDHRIFPSLPLRSEEEIAAEEEAERAALDARAASQEPLDEADLPEASIAISYEPEPVEPQNTGPIARYGAFPVNPLPDPEPEIIEPQAVEPELAAHSSAEPEPMLGSLAQTSKPASAFGEEPFLDFPTIPLRFEAKDVRREEPQPFPAQVRGETPQAPSPLEYEVDDDWEEDAPLGLEPEIEDTSATYAHDETGEQDGSYTDIEDEPVDGYAFMYAHNPRGRTLQALADGESNSLRAKLLQERADAAAQEESRDRRSIFARFAHWLRGLFG